MTMGQWLSGHKEETAWLIDPFGENLLLDRTPRDYLQAVAPADGTGRTVQLSGRGGFPRRTGSDV